MTVASYDRIQDQVAVTDYETCNAYFDMRDILDSEQVCATVRQNCDFPSGSSLQRPHETMDKISAVQGVISLRKDCKFGESQVVFTRVAKFLQWIENVVGGVGNSSLA